MPSPLPPIAPSYGAQSFRLSLAILLGIACVLRLAYFIEYVSVLPFAGSPVGDSLVYLQQASDIAQGRSPSPALLAFSPLYGYFLWLAMKPLIPAVPLLVQMLLGLGLIAWVYRAVAERFDAASALASTLLLMSYGVLLYLESKILSETLGIVLAFGALIVFTSRGVRESRIGPCMASGALAALAVLARASLIFGLPFFALVALLPMAPTPEPLRRRMARSGLWTLAMGAVLCLNGALNLERSGRFVPVIMVSQTLDAAGSAPWSGNLGDAARVRHPSPFDVVEQARLKLSGGGAPTAPEISIAQRLARMDWLGVLASAPSKIAATFRNRESSFQYGFQAERHALATLGLLPSSFGLLVLWGIVGFVVLWRRHGPSLALAFTPWILGGLVTTVLYMPTTRYRLGMVTGMVLLGGLGVMEIWRGRTARRGLVLCIALSVLSLGLVVHSYRLGPGDAAEWQLQLAASHGLAGRHGKAKDAARRALLAAPDDEDVVFRARKILEH